MRAIAAPRWRVSWRHDGAHHAAAIRAMGKPRSRVAWRRYGAHTLHDARYRGAAMACINATTRAQTATMRTVFNCSVGGVAQYFHSYVNFIPYR